MLSGDSNEPNTFVHWATLSYDYRNGPYGPQPRKFCKGEIGTVSILSDLAGLFIKTPKQALIVLVVGTPFVLWFFFRKNK